MAVELWSGISSGYTRCHPITNGKGAPSEKVTRSYAGVLATCYIIKWYTRFCDDVVSFPVANTYSYGTIKMTIFRLRDLSSHSAVTNAD